MDDAIDSRLPPGYVSFPRQSQCRKFASGAEAPDGLKPASRDEFVHSTARSRTLSFAGGPIRLYGDPQALQAPLAEADRTRVPHTRTRPGVWESGVFGQQSSQTSPLPRQNFPDEQEQGSGPARILGHIRRRLPKESASSLSSRLSCQQTAS